MGSLWVLMDFKRLQRLAMRRHVKARTALCPTSEGILPRRRQISAWGVRERWLLVSLLILLFLLLNLRDLIWKFQSPIGCKMSKLAFDFLKLADGLEDEMALRLLEIGVVGGISRLLLLPIVLNRLKRGAG